MSKAPKATRKGAPRSPRRHSRALTVAGNRLTLLPDGPERLEALIGLINGAKQSLRLLYYIYTPDAAGGRVRDAILAAVNRGVEVALLLDGFGSASTPHDYFDPLFGDRGKYCRFHPSYGRRYLLRNHQKMALADAETPDCKVMIGGFNIADDYFMAAGPKAWRDLALIVAGPAAARLMPYYDRLMEWASADKPTMRNLRGLIYKYSETSGKLQWQLGGPTAKLSPWGVSTCRDLAHGRDVEMIAAYFAPTWGLLKRIARAGERGRARVITAARSDNTATIAAARFTYKRLLRTGVEVFEYARMKLHTKLVIMDDVVHIGSSNLDIRSLYLNMELMLRVHDAGFAQRMREYFESELKESVQITPAVHDKRSTWLNRIRWAVSFFLVTSFDYGVTRSINFNLAGD